jgi:GNAT superfamily N-acetyltransferase
MGEISFDELSIEPLSTAHNSALTFFDCEEPDLNEYIHDDALWQQEKRLNRTFLFLHKSRIVGFISLNADLTKPHYLRKEDVITKKGSDKPAYSDGFPCALIGRLAVDKEYKGHNIGTSIVYWAVGIVADQVSKYIGVTYITVDLKAESRNFYIKLGFIDMYEMQRQLRNSSHSRTRSIASEMLQTPISPSSLMRLKWASLVIKIAPVCRQVAA